MLRRIAPLVVLVAYLSLAADVVQVLCFGADGHIAVEGLDGAEHQAMSVTGTPPLRAPATVTAAAVPSSVHLDAWFAETAVRTQSNPLLPPVVVPRQGEVTAEPTVAGRSTIALPPLSLRLAVLDSTVLRI